MKNIYEDGNDRQKIEDISSGDFDFGESYLMSKRPERPVPPKVRNAISKNQPKKQVTKEPEIDDTFKPQGKNEQSDNQQLPFQLTQEQVTMLLSQYFMNQSGQQPVQQPSQPQPLIPVEEAKNTDNLPEQNPGTRILYQSPDFDKLDNSPSVSDEERRRSFYDDDDFLEEKGTSNRPPEIHKGSAPKTTGNSGIKIREVSVTEVTVPGKKPKPIVYSSATGVKAAPPKNTSARISRNFAVEEINDNIPDEEGKEEKKKPDTKNIVRIVVLSISILAIIIASCVLLKEYKLHKDNKDFENEISGLIIDEPTTKSGSKKDKKKQKLTIEQQWAQIREEYPNTIFPANIQLKYAKLYATNNDFVGYLEAEGVNLSLPIVQTDNDSTYLGKNFYGASTKYGCPFVSYVNNIGNLDMNTIIWGHHMNDGTVFGALDAYKSIEGFKKAPVITFNTMYQDYSWKVIAAFITNACPEDDNDYVFEYYFSSLSSVDRYSAYLNELAQRSLYDTGVDVLPTDKLLTLSTCSHEFDDARFVVVARLVRPGETAEVDVSAATVNQNPRYPQMYYTKKKLTNPYANAQRWVVG